MTSARSSALAAFLAAASSAFWAAVSGAVVRGAFVGSLDGPTATLDDAAIVVVTGPGTDVCAAPTVLSNAEAGSVAAAIESADADAALASKRSFGVAMRGIAAIC